MDLKRVTKGREKRPIKALLYSAEGVGKTKFAAGSDDPFVLDADRGSHLYNVTRFVPETWAEAKEVTSAVEAGSIKCQTFVVDSVTQLEALSHKDLFGGEAISSWQKGYGRGDDHALMHWREYVAQLERIWRSGKNVLLLAHAAVKSFSDPAGPTYDRYSVAMRPNVAGLLLQWPDYVLRAAVDVSMTPGDKAVTSGARSIYTKRTPAYDAKARGSLGFPEQLPLSWVEFAAAVEMSSDDRKAELSKEVESLLAEVSDEKLTAQVREWVKDKPERLIETRNILMGKLAERRKAASAGVAA